MNSDNQHGILNAINAIFAPMNEAIARNEAAMRTWRDKSPRVEEIEMLINRWHNGIEYTDLPVICRVPYEFEDGQLCCGDPEEGTVAEDVKDKDGAIVFAQGQVIELKDAENNEATDIAADEIRNKGY